MHLFEVLRNRLWVYACSCKCYPGPGLPWSPCNGSAILHLPHTGNRCMRTAWTLIEFIGHTARKWWLRTNTWGILISLKRLMARHRDFENSPDKTHLRQMPAASPACVPNHHHSIKSILAVEAPATWGAYCNPHINPNDWWMISPLK